MDPFWRIALIGAGFGLLAASLAAKKKAGCLAVAGVCLLTGLAVRDADPVLALGAFALAAAGPWRPARRDVPPQQTGSRGTRRKRPGQHP